MEARRALRARLIEVWGFGLYVWLNFVILVVVGVAMGDLMFAALGAVALFVSPIAVHLVGRSLSRRRLERRLSTERLWRAFMPADDD